MMSSEGLQDKTALINTDLFSLILNICLLVEQISSL